MGRAGANSAIDVGYYKSEDHAEQSSSGVLSWEAVLAKRP